MYRISGLRTCNRLYHGTLHQNYITGLPSRAASSTSVFFHSYYARCTSRRLSSQVDDKGRKTFRENVYTIPNLLTVSRIAACPVLGWSILDGNFNLATSLLLYAGLTDLV
jgi:hypothetical protein